MANDETQIMIYHLNTNATDLLSKEIITDWEYGFIKDIAKREMRTYSDKQQAVIDKIWDKYEATL